MASFSVDITSVKFAATNTGYKDITITGMPQAGVNCTITGTNASAFGFRIPGDQNVYRVYTTSNTNIGTNSNLKIATFKITNLSDSTDYVEVSLEQCAYLGKPIVDDVENVYDNIYAYYENGFGRASIFAEYRTDDVGTYCILYVDGYEGTTTLSESWAYYTVESAYSDTGFKQVKIGATNNYNASFRSCNITFPGTGGTDNASVLYQNAYPSSSAGCTSPIVFSGSGGTERITLNTGSEPAANIDYLDWYTTDGLTYTIVESGSGTLYYDVTVGPNQSDKVLKGAIVFEKWSTSKRYGFTLVRQDPGSGPVSTLTVDPDVLNYPASGGAKVLDVTYATSLSTNESSFPDWLGATYVSTTQGSGQYTITAATNTSTSSRNFDFELADVNMSLVVPITQAGGDPASLSISPTSNSVSSSSGSVQITVTSSGISEVQYSISDSWITYGSKSGNVYTFNYAAKSTTGQRTGTITFYGGGLSETYTLVQAGASQLIVSPNSYTVSSSSGSVSVTVTGSDNISYSISGSWLTYSSKSGNVYTFNYTANSSSSSRTSTVTFSAPDMVSGTYTLTQQASVEWSVSPSSLTFTKTGGEKTVTVVSSDVSHLSGTGIPEWVEVTYSVSGNTTTYYITAEENTSEYARSFTLHFYDSDHNSYVPVYQNGTVSPSLSVYPTSSSVDSNSGSVYASVTARGIQSSDISYHINGNWITYNGRTGNVFYFNYTENTSGSSRTGTVRFTALGRSKTYTLTQAAGSGPSPVITVSPTSESVSSAFGVIDVTATGADDITHSISQGSDWITYRGKTGDVFSFDYTSNTSTSSRTGIITFSASGATSGTYTLIQAGENPGPGPGPGPSPENPRTLKTYPKKLRYYSEGGDKRVSFINRPENGIGYEITYTDGSGWLSVSNSGSEKVVTATANSGIRRKASIKFYDLNNSDNYVIVPVIQGSINFYASVWMDDLYYPDDRDEDGNYYYRITDQDTEKNYFVGVSTIPPGWQGNVGGIDVPRLVENYLDTDFSNSSDWEDMSTGYCTVDVYNMTEGDPGVVDDTFKYWNDWSRFERRYDYTRYLNDPINGRGSDMMLIPVCVYYDDAATFSIVETDKYGNTNTNTYQTPAAPFVMCSKTFTDTKTADFMQDNDVIFSYEMNHCGPGAFIYRNRFGGWDSFLIEGNISKTDNYTKQNWRRSGEYNQEYSVDYLKYFDENVTDSININTTYEAYTGWLTDEESERLVFHLLSSPTVYFQNLHKENQLFDTDSELNLLPVRITASSAEYKKFRNGKRLVNYLITFEKCNIEKVRN